VSADGPGATHFDVCGPLPSGTTVLEASAGTGKTFTIAALATRYLAEGLAELPALMLVTFGRAATQELRERVRERLVSTERALADPAAARRDGDLLVQHLTAASHAEVALRRRRLTTALADFDAATIATTHGFCEQMLRGLGVAGDVDPDSTFVESVDDLETEVVQDLYLRKFGRTDSPGPQVSYDEARAVVHAAIEDRQAALTPEEADPDSPAGLRVGIARAARVELAARKRQHRVKDYDDLVTRLRDALADPARGTAAAERVRGRYRLVMVDEFQDTDPVQWEILERAFHGHCTLVLIGDPKQAIYAFRGGDVVTYLRASATATTHATMGRNWRSDGALLEAFDAVFQQAALGDADIVVRPVGTTHPGRRLVGAPDDTPLRVRHLGREDVGYRGRSVPGVAVVRAAVVADLTGDVVRLLDSGARLSTDGPARRVEPGDVAVLVQTHNQADAVRAALTAADVPAVLTGATNVFGTEIARDWLVLLQALDQPHRATRVRTAALTSFLGWSADQLGAAGVDAMDVLGPRVREWADLLVRRGVPALLEAATEAGLSRRLLSLPDGERRMTDLRHVAETLHAAATSEELGTSALVQWLERRIGDASDDVTEERSRRLDSDADAVQVLTVWRSKGLEFPFVYAPFAWDRWKQTPAFPRYHTADQVRRLDVGGRSGADYEAHCARHADEEAGEDLRLLYVALTRAQCQVVTWWAPSRNTAASPLHRLLFADVAPGTVPPATVDVPGDDTAADRLAQLVTRGRGTVSVSAPEIVDGVRWSPVTGPAPALSAAVLDRHLDTVWRRTSYTGLTSSAHAPAGSAVTGVASEPEEADLEDEPVPPPVDDPTATPMLDQQRLRAVVSPMDRLPAGTAFGIVAHAVLERVDTGADDLGIELAVRSREVLDRRLTRGLDPDALAAGMEPALRTPLGPLVGDTCLADVSSRDRLAELDFELPLAGGDAAVHPAGTLRAIGALLRRALPDDDPFAGYPDRLEDLPDRHLRGFLVGSLDVVLRVRGGPGEPRYVVGDYKTNWLAATYPGGGEPLTAWHYRPEALAETMLAAHYPLQAVLYLVALHRYLRWRQPGYDPDRHLGGVLYLFLRGMSGPDTPVVDGARCGVFSWRPPTGLVEELSGLLADGAP